MTAPRKRKTRKKRLADTSLLGLETGKLYEFKGRSRLLYREQIPRAPRRTVLPKIHTNDHFLFLEADLWFCDTLKKKTIWASDHVEDQIQKIKDSNNKIVEVTAARWNRSLLEVYYEPDDILYSGMMYVGFGNKFGWINIVQMSKEDVLKQFKQVAARKQ